MERGAHKLISFTLIIIYLTMTMKVTITHVHYISSDLPALDNQNFVKFAVLAVPNVIRHIAHCVINCINMLWLPSVIVHCVFKRI